MEIQIAKSNNSTWLNGPTHCLARFSEGGYEVNSADIRETGPLVKFMSNIPAGIYLWIRFKDAVKTAHQVVLQDEDAPSYLRGALGVA